MESACWRERPIPECRSACPCDWGIRDTHQFEEKNCPVYYKYRIPNGSRGLCQITHDQVSIKIGDASNRARRDLADLDGVLCIPRDIAHVLLLRAEELRVNETKISG